MSSRSTYLLLGVVVLVVVLLLHHSSTAAAASSSAGPGNATPGPSQGAATAGTVYTQAQVTAYDAAADAVQAAGGGSSDPTIAGILAAAQKGNLQNVNSLTASQFATLGADAFNGQTVGLFAGVPIDNIDATMIGQGYEFLSVEWFKQLMQGGYWGGGVGGTSVITDPLVPGTLEYSAQLNAWQAELDLYGYVDFDDMTSTQAKTLGFGRTKSGPGGSSVWTQGKGMNLSSGAPSLAQSLQFAGVAASLL